MKIDEEDLTFLKCKTKFIERSLTLMDRLQKHPIFNSRRNSNRQMSNMCEIQQLLVVTNLRNSWVCKLTKEQILKDKELYNKSIQTTSFQGVLDLLELALKYDPQAEYSFQMNDQSLFYGYSNVIKIYTLTWVFNCIEIETEFHFKILINDIVNPLLLTVTSLENRCNTYKTAFTQLEQDYIRRLNEKERQQYKCRDKEEDLSIYIQDDQIDAEKICQISFTPAANYFIQYYAINKLNKMQQQAKKRQPQQQAELNSNMKKKEQIWQTYEATLTDMFEGKSKQIVDIVNKEEKPDKSKNTKKKQGFL